MKHKFLIIFSLCLLVVLQAMAFKGDHNKAPLKVSKVYTAPQVTQAELQIIVPVNVTGFNADVIANGGPAVSGENIAMVSTTASLYPDEVFFSEDYRGVNNPSSSQPFALPADGIINSMTNPGVQYQLGDYSSNNVLLLNSDMYMDTLYFSEPARFNQISLLAANSYGYSDIYVKILFDDLTFQDTILHITNWISGMPAAINNLNVVERSTESFTSYGSKTSLFDHFIAIENENLTRKITGIAFMFDCDYTYANVGIFAVCGMNLPERPVIKEALALGTDVTVLWDSVFMAESYEVQFSIDSTFSEAAYITTYTDLTDTIFAMEDFIASPVYFTRVSAHNQAGEGQYSEVRKIITNISPELSVEPTVLNLTSAFVNFSGITVVSNAAWSSTSPAYWLPDVSGLGNRNFTLTTYANVTTLPRSAKMVFHCAGITDTLTFSQPALDRITLPYTENLEFSAPGNLPDNFAELSITTDKISENNWIVEDGWGAEESQQYLELFNYDDFDNKDHQTAQSILAFPPLNFEGYEAIEMTFYMRQTETENANGFVRIQASTDHIATWSNVGDSIPVFGKNSSDDWVKQSVDLTAYAGQTDVNLAFSGFSNDYPVCIDQIEIQGYNMDAPVVVTHGASNVLGDAALIQGEVEPNLLGTNVFFEYGLTTEYGDTAKASPYIVSGYSTVSALAFLKDLLPETIYHYRIVAINDMGACHGEDMTFTTGSAPVAPIIYPSEVNANDGNNIILSTEVDPGNAITTVQYLFGTDSASLVLSETTDTLFSPGYPTITYKGLSEETKYYYKVIASNSMDTLYSQLDSVFTPRVVYDTVINANAFLKGRYVNIGINELGAFGSTEIAPADMHVNTDLYLGFTADRDKDGWFSGDPGFSGDYFYPGSPEEGWGLTFNGTNYNNNQNDYVNDISGAFTSVKDSANMLIADWEGEVDGVSVRQRVKMPHDSLFFTIEVSLRNNNASTLHNIYYMRNVDPDNEERNTEIFSTLNTIVKQNTDADNLALVSAVGTRYNTYLGLGTNDARARAFFGGFSNRDALYVYETAERYEAGSNVYDDIAIALSFKIDSLPSGECTSLSYAYILDENQLEAALRSTLLSVSGSEGQAEINTLKVCMGTDVPLTINNGEDYEWTWEPSAGLSSTTGSTVIAQNVTTAKTYTATGRYECFIQKFTINLVPVELPVATITNASQEIFTGDPIEAMVLGTSNNITGTKFNWTRTEPVGISSSIPVSGTDLNIGDMIEGSFANSTQQPVDVVFTVTPYATALSACPGTSVIATITVNPLVSSLAESEEVAGIYPNPVRTYCTVYSNDQEGEYRLLTINGRIVLSGKLSGNSTMIDMSNLSSGLYILNLQTGKGIRRIKVVKE